MPWQKAGNKTKLTETSQARKGGAYHLSKAVPTSHGSSDAKANGGGVQGDLKLAV
jgi:hypothetical protein